MSKRNESSIKSVVRKRLKETFIATGYKFSGEYAAIKEKNQEVTVGIIWNDDDRPDGIKISLSYFLHFPDLEKRTKTFITNECPGLIDQIKPILHQSDDVFVATAIFKYALGSEKNSLNVAKWIFNKTDDLETQERYFSEIECALAERILPVLDNFDSVADSLAFITDFPIAITQYGQYIIPFALLELGMPTKALQWIKTFRKQYFERAPYQLFAARFIDKFNLTENISN